MTAFDIRRVEITASTNDDARQAAESGAPGNTVFWALQQTSGRGRQGRQWQSPNGNLYTSVLLRPPEEKRDYGRYSFIASLAIADAIEHYLPNADIELKWPNDVMVAGKKISGILLEAGEGWLVIGLGLNILHTPENPLYPATSLKDEGVEPPLEEILNKILQTLTWWRQQPFTDIRMAWLSRARKGQMRVRLPREELQGQFGGLDENGNLRLILEDGAQRLIGSGDVFF